MKALRLTARTSKMRGLQHGYESLNGDGHSFAVPFIPRA